MENLDTVVEKYKSLPSHKLISLAQNPEALRIEVIPHLQAELLNRDLKDEALALSSFLVNKPKSFKDMTNAELSELVRERVESGESLESIKLDLKENGVDFFKSLAEENQWKNETFDYLMHLKEEGDDETTINQKMNSAYGVNEEETDELRSQLKSKGKQNLIIGYTIVVVMVILAIAAFAVGGGIGIGAVLLIGIGVWRIAEGHRQRR